MGDEGGERKSRRHVLEELINFNQFEKLQNAFGKETDKDKKHEIEKEMHQKLMFIEKIHKTLGGTWRRICEGPSRQVNRAHKKRMGSEASVLDHIRVQHSVPFNKKIDKSHKIEKETKKKEEAKIVVVDHTPKRKKKPRVDKKDRVVESIYCKNCGAANSEVYEQRKARMICTQCGICRENVQCNEVQARDSLWRDSMYRKGNSYSYKRSNHLYSWMLRIQAKESTVVPDEHLHGVLGELRKMQLNPKDPNKVTPERIREILKKLKLPKYYNSVHLIRYLVCKHRPPQMTEKQEQEVMDMFDDVVLIYTQLQKRGIVKRSNMLSYSYTLTKMLELLGPEYDPFLKQLTLLKHRERLKDQEEIWRSVCDASDEFLEQPFVFHATTIM